MGGNKIIKGVKNMKKKGYNNYGKLVVCSIFIILIATSANSAVINKGST